MVHTDAHLPTLRQSVLNTYSIYSTLNTYSIYSTLNTYSMLNTIYGPECLLWVSQGPKWYLTTPVQTQTHNTNTCLRRHVCTSSISMGVHVHISMGIHVVHTSSISMQAHLMLTRKPCTQGNWKTQEVVKPASVALSHAGRHNPHLTMHNVHTPKA